MNILFPLYFPETPLSAYMWWKVRLLPPFNLGSEEMNSLVDNGLFVPKIGNVPVEFFICGDMKYLLVVLGLDSAESSHPCIYCFIHKDDLGKTNKPMTPRSIEEISKKALLSKTNKLKFNCSKQPIFENVPIGHHVVDILHWFLRITDALLALLVQELQGLDEENMPTSTVNLDKCERIKKLQDCAAEIGVKCGKTIKLNFYVKKGAGGGLDWPTIFGQDKLHIFRHLDLTKFSGLSSPIEKTYLWKQVVSHYEQLRKPADWNESQINIFSNEAKKWLEIFQNIYTLKHATPYMHVYAIHFSELLRRHGSLWPFCQEMFEKFNDVSTHRYHTCTNHHEFSAHKQLLQSHIRCLNFLN